MARAPVSKTDYFSFKINLNSEKIEKFDLLPSNRLAAVSEYRSADQHPLSKGSGHRADLWPCPLIAAPTGSAVGDRPASRVCAPPERQWRTSPELC
jgi:hypothetical protein